LLAEADEQERLVCGLSAYRRIVVKEQARAMNAP
jgi:hypothetical protein